MQSTISSLPPPVVRPRAVALRAVTSYSVVNADGVEEQELPASLRSQFEESDSRRADIVRAIWSQRAEVHRLYATNDVTPVYAEDSGDVEGLWFADQAYGALTVTLDALRDATGTIPVLVYLEDGGIWIVRLPLA